MLSVNNMEVFPMQSVTGDLVVRNVLSNVHSNRTLKMIGIQFDKSEEFPLILRLAVNPLSAGTVFIRQNLTSIDLTSIDVRF